MKLTREAFVYLLSQDPNSGLRNNAVKALTEAKDLKAPEWDLRLPSEGEALL